MNTNADVTQYVIAAIEANGTDVASRDEYEIDAIVADLRKAAGDWDMVEAIPDEEFWGIVQQHAK